MGTLTGGSFLRGGGKEGDEYAQEGLVKFRSRCFVTGLEARDRDAHVFGDSPAACRYLTHSLENSGVMVPLAALIAHPSRHVLDDHQLVPVPKVFASPLCCQAPDAAPGADLTG